MKKLLPLLLLSFGLFGCSSGTKNLEAVTDNVLEIYTSNHSASQYSPVVVDYIEKTSEGEIRSVISGYFNAAKNFDLDALPEYLVMSDEMTEGLSYFNMLESTLDGMEQSTYLSETEKEQVKRALNLLVEFMKTIYQKALGSYEIEDISVDGTTAKVRLDLSVVDLNSPVIEEFKEQLGNTPFGSGSSGSIGSYSPEAILDTLESGISLLKSVNFPMTTTQLTLTLNLDGAKWKIADGTIMEQGNIFV